MRKLIFLLIAVFTFSLGQAQIKVGGETLPETITFESEKMKLKGAGVREKFWMDMYVGALYLQEDFSNAQDIIIANEPMAIKLHMVSKMITSDRMIEAVNEGFENATDGNSEKISVEIEKFKKFFAEKINKGDVFDLVYFPESGVHIYKNKKELGTIEGMEFKRALFGIWLSEKPADEDLKNGMLSL